jgi:MoaA/NifB/PqqE/SkfB family radical SAM enzyme
MTPRVCNYYLTLRCNDTCEFSFIWQNEEYAKIEEKPVDLSILKQEGIKNINFTGGEPLLREDLPEILRSAKELGFKIELTTNGILYGEKGRLIGSLVDRLLFSLDYPIASEHDRSRGVECFHTVISAIEHARVLGEKPILNFTLTRDSVRFLPEMIELAERLKVPVYLNPVSDFYGTQGFEPATIDHIKYYARRRNVSVNLAALEFVRAGGNRVILPRCRAAETTVTVMPDGSRVSPCFFNPGGRPGKEDVCSGCMRWPYMLPSFSRGIDRYFWLDRYSEWIKVSRLRSRQGGK